MRHDTYSVTIKRENKQYYAYSEDLPGVYGVGASVEEAESSVLEAIRLYLLRIS
jgi:predicted RNase H-like HicB family nuclease